MSAPQKLKFVTVTVTERTADWVSFTLSDYYNEARPEFKPDNAYEERYSAAGFDSLAADHGLTAADFPIGKPVRVSEPA